MGDKEDYLTSYRVFFENFAATVNPEDQLPVNIAGYTITETELPGEVIYWTTQYLTEKLCPATLMTPLRRIVLDEVCAASKKQPNEFGFKSDESVYIALRLMQAVTARVNTVCLRYLDNSRLDSLPPPPPDSQKELKTVSAATKNSRRVMEDRHVEIGNLEALFGIETTEPTSLYAVYDGHAGSAAATYCAAHLHQYLVESEHFVQNLPLALRDAFLRTDAEFVRKTKSNQERACGGSTAVAVTVRGQQLHAAWAGDSQALLAKRMRLMQLVRPHKPDREDERERIESSGGTVMFWGTWRVNGQLAVSRAIGDAQYKPYVTARPEIATVDLDGDEDFVVIACDGLWDFVSEDEVALSVYRQIAADPDDLKAVTKRLIIQAKRQGSCDNISIIVVFLKDARHIKADNCPPMDLGLENALANAPPFAVEPEPAFKRQLDIGAPDAKSGECADTGAGGDNGVDNSDSDSEDFGPETAVDAEDADPDSRSREPAPPTPPAHTVEQSHVDGALVDNVGESGEESEDEWNYFKGEGERDDPNPSDEQDEEVPGSETPCQDNSAWESSSVDMNSSPLNPDAPVFVPGTVAGADILLAESPRKPLPMDDIELPDVAQFQTEVVVRPAELLDLDNCDQLNGHHNLSIDEASKEHINGNDKFNMDSLGFGFNMSLDSDKIKDTGLIQNFDRIQKDTTDFCNIEVFPAHTETNPFAAEGNEELLERLKNKERDPMSMSFYQEKDDDTSERLAKNDTHVDLNAVQTLPDSDEEDLLQNGQCDNDLDKENIFPENQDLLAGGDYKPEPNNDFLRLEERTDNHGSNFGQGDNLMDYSNTDNMQAYTNTGFELNNQHQAVAQTDTPESHKLLFEQIPEIPDGKSSELGFASEDLQDQSEKDTSAFSPQEEFSQDIEMQSKREDSPFVEVQPEEELSEFNNEDKQEDSIGIEQPADIEVSTEELIASPVPTDENKLDNDITSELVSNVKNVIAQVHDEIVREVSNPFSNEEFVADKAPQIQVDHAQPSDVMEDLIQTSVSASPLPSQSPIPETPLAVETESPAQSPLPVESRLPVESPLPTESPAHSPLPVESRLPVESPLPSESPTRSPLPVESRLPVESSYLSESPAHSPLPVESHLPVESPLPSQSPLPKSPEPSDPVVPASPAPADSSLPTSPTPVDSLLPVDSPVPPSSNECQITAASPLPGGIEPAISPESVEDQHEVLHADNFKPTDESLVPVSESPFVDEASLPVESSIVRESPLPTSPLLVVEPSITELSKQENFSAPSPLPDETVLAATSPAPSDKLAGESCESRLTPEIAPEDTQATELSSAPAPDIVPEERVELRTELVTDIDTGVTESRAQEICVPVTSEIEHEDDEHRATATPPPTPAVDLSHKPLAPDTLDLPLVETPIAADVAAAPIPAAAAAAVAAAAATVTAAAATAAAVSKSKTATKKSPTTPTLKSTPSTKTTPKPSTATRTPASAAKKPTPASSATKTSAIAKSSPARTPTSAVKTTTSSSKAAPSPRVAPAKPSTPKTPLAKTTPLKSTTAAAKEAPVAAKVAPISRAAPAPRPAAAPRTSAPRPTSATSAPPARTAPRAAPAPRPATARPAPRVPAAAKPKDASAPAKAQDKKPLMNGDVKAPAKKPTPTATRVAAPRAAATTAAKPAPRPGATRTALSGAPAPTAAKRAASATNSARASLDKQTKDLANKRITAKTAPPRTNAIKAVPKHGAKPPADPAKPPVQNGEPAVTKPPPSPPAADNAALPDVIA